MPRKKKPKEGKIEKPEDRQWHEWFNKLDKTEHHDHLRQLGLDDEDIEVWDEIQENNLGVGGLFEEAPKNQTTPKKPTQTKKKKKG